MVVRPPCETCRNELGCDVKSEFLPKYFFTLFEKWEDREMCAGYDPAYYRGLEGVLQ